jgi:hypothetical protein
LIDESERNLREANGGAVVRQMIALTIIVEFAELPEQGRPGVSRPVSAEDR